MPQKPPSKFIELTDPSGHPVWIAPQWVTKIQIVTSGYSTDAKTLVTMGGSAQAVREPPLEVIKLLTA